MNKPVLFTILFEDNSMYLGGENYKETKWLDIPKDKKIKRIFYTMPDGNSLLLSGYEKYFYMIEATHDLTGKLAGQMQLAYSYLFCKDKETVVVYKICLSARNPKENIGDVKRTVYSVSNEFIKSLNPEGWRG